MRHYLPAGLAALLWVAGAPAASFVNWESPHVSPLDITPDGSKLLAVNTADNRLEVFAITPGGLTHLGAVPVGLDPVSVRARTNSEAWVVNHISDSVSIVDLATMNVKTTITTGDEPTDVIFAGSPQRAFVSVSQINQVKVYDPLNPIAAPAVLNIQGEDPRMLATDGTTVYAAIFDSGNRTTIISELAVSNPALNPYPGDPNPPPNSGSSFSPAFSPGLPTPPAVSLILKKDAADVWRDDNGGNWDSAVTWDLHDHDIAKINVSSLAITYVSGTMNLNMALAVSPGGQITAIGTDAINHIRFEPNVRGTFVRVMGATFSAGSTTSTSVFDLNPHLTYATPSVSQALRDQSIGDPRGFAWDATGTRGYITGMGSNNVVVVDAGMSRVGLVNVGQGPTGVRVDGANGRVYVLNKFEGAVSIISEASMIETSRVPFFDPSPAPIKLGRPHLYGTHQTSGLGQASCASCHIDGRMDQVAWDLGDPSGQVQPFVGICNGGLGGCEDPHPMKGPMTTQTLIGIIGTEPFHWRGDRTALSAFNPAFVNLMGADSQLSPAQMTEFTNFVATLKQPPNPHRNLDGTLKTTPLFGSGTPSVGFTLYNTALLDGGLLRCVQCHMLPTGTNGQIFSGAVLQATQSMKVPQLRNMYEKSGFSLTSMNNNRGFGFIHDGSDDNLVTFLSHDVFSFPAGAAGLQQKKDIEAFLFSFATDTHAAVGVQTTVINGAAVPAPQVTLINQMVSMATVGTVGLVVKGTQGGLQRGYALSGTQFQSDRAAETLAPAALLALAAPGSELTYTIVPAGSQTRIGIDRDEDGFFDRDEIDAGSNPADDSSTPLTICHADLDGNHVVNGVDLAQLLAAWSGAVSYRPCPPQLPADLNQDCKVNGLDLAMLLAAWGACP